ncbi:MAG: DNA polymerase III subunit epsilon [Alphaproteobacteria bacterium]|nr:DNA polymerase III subunit epsilon [Alphaproteobacteria bacterium]
MRVVIFDTETTGVAPDAGDRIVEIGCVEMIGFEIGRTWHAYLDPERDVPEEVVRVHGLTRDFLRGKPKFSEVVEDLIAFFGPDPIVAHNAEFDRRFLNAELERLNRIPAPQDRFIDTLAIAKKVMPPGKRLSLDALSKEFRLDRLGFDLSARKGAGGHGALLDAKMLAEIYIGLQGGREQKLFAEDKPRTAEREATAAQITITQRAPRPVPMGPLSTPEERDAHAAFLAQLGKEPLWSKIG